MYQEKLIPVLKAKIEKENHFNMCAQEGIVNMRYMTKYDTKNMILKNMIQKNMIQSIINVLKQSYQTIR